MADPGAQIFPDANLLAHALNLRRLLFEIRVEGVYFLLLLRNYRLQDPDSFVLRIVLRLHILAHTETTLTIRLAAKQREALRRRAAAEKRSESALVRDLIDREMRRGFDFDRIRHLIGSIASPPKHWEKDSWRKHIRQRNWR